MHYLRRPSWWLPESAATPEQVFWNRRKFLMAGAAVAGAAALGGAEPSHAMQAGAPFSPSPKRNSSYNAGRAITPESVNSSYNNFYEFGSSKDIHQKAQALPSEDWTLKIDGMVANPVELSIEDLIARAPVEERVVRHRCVEAWSMVVAWIGFPVSALRSIVEPMGSARYVRFESFEDSDVAPGQRTSFYPWPYVEGLTIDEAMNDLAFLVVGAYGKVLPKQFGAPIRLHLPWKYGFKSNKSLTRISFTDRKPKGFWEEINDDEYGFWANVNPEVSHPRWSQANERVLGADNRIPTQIYNGYGDQVAGMYSGMQDLGAALYR